MNRLPDATNLPIYLSGPESRDAANKMLSESLSLADELFELQEVSLAPMYRNEHKSDFWPYRN